MHVDLWDSLAARAAVTIDPSQHQLLHRYLDLLLEANRRINLTRITSSDSAQTLHIGDALTLLPHLPPGPLRIADVGAGGGIPGIPLAIIFPQSQVTLIESVGKKAGFLREVVDLLKLANTQVLDQRAEDVAAGPARESFDVAVARAVAETSFLAEWCLPLVRKGGKVLAMKGQRIHDELPAARRAIQLLGGGEAIVHPVQLPGTDHRVIVEIPKIGRTDRRYPRRATVAKGKPLQ